jgi:hypothetical protein
MAYNYNSYKNGQSNGLFCNPLPKQQTNKQGHLYSLAQLEAVPENETLAYLNQNWFCCSVRDWESVDESSPKEA